MDIFIGIALATAAVGFYAYNTYRQEVRLQDAERKIAAAQDRFTNK